MSTDLLRDSEAVHVSSARTLVGIDGRALRRGHATGELISIRRGVFTDTARWVGLTGRERHLLRMRAVRDTRKGDAAFSHQSAAALWDLPIIGPWPEAVHVCTPDGRRRSSSRGVLWHNTTLVDGDIVEVDGVLVTSRLRTLLDLARTNSFLSAVATLDAALRQEALAGGADAAAQARELLQDRIAALGRAPGSGRARCALDFATHLAHSPGESVSRVQMHVLRFPKPELQFPVLDRNGTLWHSDFGWPAYRQLGEFDGFTKYTRAAYTKGQPIEEIVWAEKQREDLMRAVGYGMSRWLWPDALAGRLLARILGDAGLPNR
ncbi:hypothetical protein D9V29_03530 [Mycetocola manganoxydans]|uniref:Transcriptional regulator, AbiEi antitoxin, Type IV TA system n=1 Tax=Mycetocola manganoxydans TaxID=699879 RepID=A0A3L6ZYH0_9MICO|nr:hypothetical protein [Mycetocola manganoxydans]RLP73086.1 hypothetical protein D9V29_03530 [Mycetocola manganoxydans]GHD44155.1 hypothetical protein GCM10008097_11860 [Mycetocola manganoxydans]